MKFSKRFSKVARESGDVVYRRIQKLPLGIKLNAMAFELAETSPLPRAHDISVSVNGALLFRGTFTGGRRCEQKFDKPIAMPRGEHEILTSCSGFGAMEPVDVTIEVDVSMSLFS